MAFRFEVPTIEDIEQEDADVPQIIFIPKKPKLTEDVVLGANNAPAAAPQPQPNAPAALQGASPGVSAPTSRTTSPAPQAANMPGFVRASALPQSPAPPAAGPPPFAPSKSSIFPAAKRASAKVMASKPASTMLTIHERQRKNPVVMYIKNVRSEFNAHIGPDFVMTANACAVFLSIQYHMLHPEYIKKRVAEIPPKYSLRVLLVLIDTEQHGNSITFLNKFAIDHKMTLILTWSNREAAHYIEAYNSFEHKPPDAIKERVKEDLFDQAVDCFTQIRHISTPNVVSLLQHFGSVKNIITASLEQLSMIPGLGHTKVKRLHDTFNRPFNAALQQQRRESVEPAAAPVQPTVAAPASSSSSSSANTKDTEESSGYSVRISDL